MRRRISGLFAVLQREINFILKDKDLIVIILLSPIFYACFYGSAYFYKSEHDVPVAVVDMDKSSLSQQLIRNLDAHQLININEVLPDLIQLSTGSIALSHMVLYLSQRTLRII
jgi:ABC-2 type transport system permease protein